jgi:hypothetical protein
MEIDAQPVDAPGPATAGFARLRGPVISDVDMASPVKRTNLFLPTLEHA